MRQKRAKSYKKQMQTYNTAFKFREPHQVIIDSSLLSTTQAQSYDTLKGLSRTLQTSETLKPMITQCCIEQLYTTKNQTLIDIAKSFERRKCNHRTAIAPSDCIHSIVDIKGVNKHRYIVATQDAELRKRLRRVPGVPLIYMNRSVMVMEPLSDASRAFSQAWEESKLTGGLNDLSAGIKRKEEDGEDKKKEEVGDGEASGRKKRKGPKGPNPLSVKKKKKVDAGDDARDDAREKKPTRRKRRGNKSGERKSDGNGDGDGDAQVETEDSNLNADASDK
ncbi:uncharacterized protein LODBEIA_P10130 [Lodderomyces beijingensis]|uniref:UTP23 sensor motif region domain-containing protein n=1 Tax=Lodderomyces beijingensis TaxID=1775926 RepID=A0ABP0ZF54_9ASCO